MNTIIVRQDNPGSLYVATFAEYESDPCERKEDAFQDVRGQAVRGGYWDVNAGKESRVEWTNKVVVNDTFTFEKGYEGKEIPPERRVKSFIIDVETHSLKNILRRIKKLKSTISAEDGGVYWEDPTCAQIWLESTKTENEIDEWLYALTGPNTDYIGVVERKEE